MPAPGFAFTTKQEEALELLLSPATHIALFGGSRSGKTFLLLFAMVTRAILVPGARQAVFRSRFNHLKHSVIFDTFPRVMALCYPDVPYELNKTDWFAEFFNGSRIIFGGLDEKERTEKVLGLEVCGVLFNECSQITMSARNKAMTRLAQNVGLPLRAWYDCNPPQQSHWVYKTFVRKLEPMSGMSLTDPVNYAALKINPVDNTANIAPDYIKQLEALPESDKRRFLHGEFAPSLQNALWTADQLDGLRVARDQIPELRRVVVAVDPSGCESPDDLRADEIGIVACGIDRQGQGYVLEDVTGRYSPDGWAKAALGLSDRWAADRLVCEANFGGAMVENTIRAVRRNVPVKMVHASRGKTQRAEPVSALYEQKKVRHLGVLVDAEEELCNFSSNGYMGERSPNRADAIIWGLTELMIEKKRSFAVA